MQELEQSVMEAEFNGCLVTLFFVDKPIDGVIENVQSILSNAYEGRIEKEIKKLIGAENF